MEFGVNCSKGDAFDRLIQHLCGNLQDHQYYDVRFLCLHLIRPGSMSRISNMQDLLTALIHRDFISADDVSFLWDVLITIERYDLAEDVQRYFLVWDNE